VFGSVTNIFPHWISTGTILLPVLSGFITTGISFGAKSRPLFTFAMGIKNIEAMVTNTMANPVANDVLIFILHLRSA
jgi:hypothetical protein